MGDQKKNVASFNEDVLQDGVYAYYTDRLSCQLANSRIDEGITNALDFSGLHILDVGSGDGTTAFFLQSLGAASVVGIDPAPNAVAAANKKSKDRGRHPAISFIVSDIESFESKKQFDLVIFSRVIHHLPDPATALRKASDLGHTVLIIEPNGWNPVLKVIEKLSAYHRAHDEKSYTSHRLRTWCSQAGFSTTHTMYVNLVPMFCPDMFAKLCHFIQPVAEKIPLIKCICCGQLLLHAKK